MKKNSLRILFGLLASLMLFSCAPSEDPTPNNGGQPDVRDNGVFVLNEGSMGNEDGSLIYLSSDGKVVSDFYFMVNNKRLGDVTQDMAFYGKNTYVISQREKADTDGRLTVFDSKTMKKEANYLTELTALMNPTHLVVLDDSHIFIRDGKGIYRFDRLSKKLTFVDGTTGATQKTMVTARDKVFAARDNKVLVIDKNADRVEKVVTLDARVSGLQPLGGDKLYVSVCDPGFDLIYLLRLSDYSVIKKNKIDKPESVSDSYEWRGTGSTSYIAADGDAVYLTCGDFAIYRHQFEKGTTEMVFNLRSVNPRHSVVYQGPAVHPVTKHIFLNSLLGYGKDYKTNTVYEVEMTDDGGKLVRRFDNLTRFPAGFFFPVLKPEVTFR